jgi:hypothetical protein
MNTNDKRLWTDGRDFYYQYIRLNKLESGLHPTQEGLERLSRNIDINIEWLRKCIDLFLFN